MWRQRVSSFSLSEWSFTICMTPYNHFNNEPNKNVNNKTHPKTNEQQHFNQLYACIILCSSVDSVPAFEAVGRRIDPSQWTQLQFGLFSVPTSGPQLVYQRPWYVLFCLWKSAYKRSLAAYRKE